MLFYFPQRRLDMNIDLKIKDTPLERTSEFDFLGLVINERLNWNAHINKIANKTARIIGILKRLHHLLPRNTLLLIYNSLFLPHINYSILAWGYSCDRIFKLQKSAIRLICSTHYYAHSEPLFKYLKVLKAPDLFKLKALKFYYRYTKNELPGYFNNMFSALPVTHPYSTRYRNIPHYATPQHVSTEKCIRHSIPKLLSDTPSQITDKIYTHSFSGFSRYVKTYYINQYSETCSIVDCFVCNNTS